MILSNWLWRSTSDEIFFSNSSWIWQIGNTLRLSRVNHFFGLLLWVFPCGCSCCQYQAPRGWNIKQNKSTLHRSFSAEGYFLSLVQRHFWLSRQCLGLATVTDRVESRDVTTHSAKRRTHRPKQRTTQAQHQQCLRWETVTESLYLYRMHCTSCRVKFSPSFYFTRKLHFYVKRIHSVVLSLFNYILKFVFQKIELLINSCISLINYTGCCKIEPHKMVNAISRIGSWQIT